MKTVIIAATFIWCGLLFGISFMEAPLKFQAPNITLELGLGIGKLVFTALNRMEWVLAVLISMALIYQKERNWIGYSYAIIFLTLIIQTFILLPVLNERVDLILNGIQPEESRVHLYYVILEVLKLLFLIIIGVLYTKTLVKNSLEAS